MKKTNGQPVDRSWELLHVLVFCGFLFSFCFLFLIILLSSV